MNSKIRIGAMLLAAGMLLTGCKSSGTNVSVINEDEKPEERTGMNIAEIENSSYGQDTQEAYLEFAFSLFSACADEGGESNVMISPASVLFAMGMTSAGAGGNTLEEMVNTMTPGQDAYSLHAFASDYNRRLNSAEDITLRSANSIWINEDSSASIYGDFLDYVTSSYDAQITELAFDQAGVAQMNNWVYDRTDGMIPSIVPNDLDPDSVMILINAIAFEADWSAAYPDSMVYESSFRNADGSTSDVTMLREEEGDIYYETDIATGFARYYGENGGYYFLAMLPTDETISAAEFASSLTAEEYNEFLASRTMAYTVTSELPEFESDCTVGLSGILYELGIHDAFMGDGTADFSNMSDHDLYISSVIHRTHIEVDREGTSAAAATAVIMYDAMAIEPNPDYNRSVILNRPFVYAIVEADTGLPLFIGTVDSL